MTKKSKSRQQAQARRNPAAQAAAAFNSPTFRGFRNKGKVVAGRTARRAPRPAKVGKPVSGSTLRTSVRVAPAAFGMVAESRSDHTITRIPVDEYISDIGSAAGLGFQGLPLFPAPVNPGNAAIFPKLSSATDPFEKYRFERLCVEFLPADSTATTGTILMNYEYDPDDVVPTTSQQVMQNGDAIAFAPWVPSKIHLDVSQNAQKWYYIAPASTDSLGAVDRQQDQAVLNAFTDNVGANVGLGALRISGVVALKGSRPVSSLSFNGTTGGTVTATTPTFSIPLARTAFNRGCSPSLRLFGGTLAPNQTIGSLGLAPGVYFVVVGGGTLSATVGSAWTLGVSAIDATGAGASLTVCSGTGTGAAVSVPNATVSVVIAAGQTLAFYGTIAALGSVTINPNMHFRAFADFLNNQIGGPSASNSPSESRQFEMPLQADLLAAYVSDFIGTVVVSRIPSQDEKQVESLFESMPDAWVERFVEMAMRRSDAIACSEASECKASPSPAPSFTVVAPPRKGHPLSSFFGRA